MTVGYYGMAKKPSPKYAIAPMEGTLEDRGSFYHSEAEAEIEAIALSTHLRGDRVNVYHKPKGKPWRIVSQFFA